MASLDLLRNRRDDPGYRAAFRAQGEYSGVLMMRRSCRRPRGLLAAWRATDKDLARPMAKARSFGTTKKEVLVPAGWLRCLQVPAVGCSHYWNRGYGPIARLWPIQVYLGASWLS